MDPATLGVTVATVLATKAAEALGKQAGDAGWGAAKGLIAKVRGWFTDHDDTTALQTLDTVERYPETQRAVDELAQHVTSAAERDDGFASAVEAELVQIGQVEQIGDRTITQIANEARDNATVRDQYAAGGDLTINRGPGDDG